MHRRQLLTSALAGSGTLVASRHSRIRVLRAQSATWELVVIQEPEASIVNGSSAFYGVFSSIANDGAIGGTLAVSDQKVSPVIWTVGGDRTKLKSGEFGAQVEAVGGVDIAGGYGFTTRLGYAEAGFRSAGNELPRIWNGGEIASVALPADAVGESGRITAVNEAGTAIGTCNRASDFNEDGMPAHFLIVDGTAAFLYSGDESIFDTFSRIYLNNNNTVLGTAEQAVEWSSGGSSGTFWVSQAALYKEGEVTILDRPADYAAATSPDEVSLNPTIAGLSDADVVVVNYADTRNGITNSRAFVYDGTTPTELESGDPALPYVSCERVSPSGLILGTASSEDRRTSERIIWRDGTPEKIGEFVNEAELTLSTLTGINDDGVICGNARDRDGAWYGVVLRPV